MIDSIHSMIDWFDSQVGARRSRSLVLFRGESEFLRPLFGGGGKHATMFFISEDDTKKQDGGLRCYPRHPAVDGPIRRQSTHGEVVEVASEGQWSGALKLAGYRSRSEGACALAFS